MAYECFLRYMGDMDWVCKYNASTITALCMCLLSQAQTSATNSSESIPALGCNSAWDVCKTKIYI